MASLMTQHLSAGWKPVQNGNEAWSASPSSGAFETSDGMLMLAANTDAQFKKLCHALGRRDILDDRRWGSPQDRAKNSESLRQALNLAFMTDAADHWEKLLEAADVPAARVRGLDEVLAEPQIKARGLLAEIHVDGHDGPIHIPAMSFKANGQNTPPQSPPAPLGGDTEQVLRAAGVDDERLQALRNAGVI
jgi:crotonobetainyl-CoA:carnitine CoA-transferase CaiB-like acyl-CoA transferase